MPAGRANRPLSPAERKKERERETVQGFAVVASGHSGNVLPLWCEPHRQARADCLCQPKQRKDPTGSKLSKNWSAVAVLLMASRHLCN